MFWHVYHNGLMAYCHSYDERADYIRNHKPADEIETRLRLFQPVKGKLPKAVIKASAAYGKVYAAYGKAYAAYDKVSAAYDKMYAAYGKAYAAYDKAYAAYGKAYAAYDKVSAAYDKVYAAYDKAVQDNLPEIKALHAKECPDCLWDGTQIVFGK